MYCFPVVLCQNATVFGSFTILVSCNRRWGFGPLILLALKFQIRWLINCWRFLKCCWSRFCLKSIRRSAFNIMLLDKDVFHWLQLDLVLNKDKSKKSDKRDASYKVKFSNEDCQENFWFFTLNLHCHWGLFLSTEFTVFEPPQFLRLRSILLVKGRGLCLVK